MTALITRLEQAEAGSRELDADLALAFNPKFSGWIKHPNLKADSPAWMQGELWPSAEEFCDWLIRNGKPCSDYAPAYTSSLDAIVALIGEKLPGQYWAVTEHPDGFVATIGGPFHSQVKGVAMTTAPIALCIAMLRAIKEGADG